MPYYIIFHWDTISSEETKKFEGDHRDFLKEVKASGKLLGAGKLAKNSMQLAGIAIMKADGIEEIFEVWNRDPYVEKGVRRQEVVEWYKLW